MAVFLTLKSSMTHNCMEYFGESKQGERIVTSSFVLTEFARATASSSAFPRCPQNMTAIGC